MLLSHQHMPVIAGFKCLQRKFYLIIHFYSGSARFKLKKKVEGFVMDP